MKKRTVSPNDILIVFYLVIFQDESGEKIELAIENTKEFEGIVVGDKGTLVFCGKRFVSLKEKLNEVEKTER